eukprot:6461226-Amphidinium_carterae.1
MEIAALFFMSVLDYIATLHYRFHCVWTRCGVLLEWHSRDTRQHCRNPWKGGGGRTIEAAQT